MQNHKVNLPPKEELERMTPEDAAIAVLVAVSFQKDTGSWKDKILTASCPLTCSPDFPPRETA